MGALKRFLRRLRNVFAPGRAERELTREVDAHLGLLEDGYRKQGLPPQEARRMARIALGGVEPAKNRHRDARSFMWLDDLRRDTGYAIRTLVHAPAFAGVAILTLALSIGANAAIITVVDHVLVRSLPLPNAERLVRMYESNPTAGHPQEGGSPPHVAEWRQASTTMDLIALVGGTSVTMTGAAEPESIAGMLVGPEFFALTGVRLAVGQPFGARDYESVSNALLGPVFVRDRPANTGIASAIISHALWQRQFGSDPAVVGRHVELNGAAAVIAGVMPAGFWLDQAGGWGVADIWLPLVESRMSAQRRYRQFTVIGRLKPDVSVAAAQADMTRVAASLAAAHPSDDAGWTVQLEPLKDSFVSEARPTLLILLGGVACVLLIACANIANLLLMRSAGRAREVAVRMAIGAGRSRLVRQWLTESTILAIAGGLGGYLIARWAMPALIAHAPLTLPHLTVITVDLRVFLIVLGLSIVTGLLCGLAPALGLRGVTVANLRTVAAVGAGRRRKWLRSGLVVVQVGLAILLLVGAGLMGRTLMAVHRVDLGFEPQHVLSFGVGLRGPRYQGIQNMLGFSRDLVTRLNQTPGVQAAGVGMVPFVGTVRFPIFAEGHDAALDTRIDVPSPGYFSALRFRLQRGRFFGEQDAATAPPVAMVNAAFARTAWGDTAVVGRRIRFDADTATDWMSVVGVIDDVRMATIETAPPPLVFVPVQQTKSVSAGNFVVRVAGDPHDALPLVRDVVRAIDPALALSRVATMDERVARLLAPRQFNLWLIGVFSALALLLAVVGIYGLINEAVTSRTPEIGVRMALGASSSQVVRMVADPGVKATAIGLLLGLTAAALATRWLGTMLFGVQPLDPITLAAVPIIFVVIAALAALAPARRATRVDPVIALRGE